MDDGITRRVDDMKKKYTTPSLDMREYQLLEALMTTLSSEYEANESDNIFDGDGGFFG